MSSSVEIHSDETTGTIRTITLRQTTADKGHIKIVSSALPGSSQEHDLKNIKADLASLTLVCQLDEFFSADIHVSVQRAITGDLPKATINVSHAIYGNGLYVYLLRTGEDDSMHTFLLQAAFPRLQEGES